ncbi:Vacuolar protein sorting-associated protein 17 [Actinomortierella ambigua]|uniref:Vacuolar protein sorting-associated protein 17 n=1 Tax=Actinomortierella ambigua TaxID=1343610 RepID=A0A9P6QDG8_9FUNG|nr:Vacuolar protein sorting-associated protein 17 [Actinomortierella ambigua]
MPVSPPSPRVRRRDLQYDGQRVDASRIKAPQYLHITVPDTDRRAKDGMFVLNVQTNIPRYRRQSYQNVTRSYLEFVRLREHLVAEHPETIVPVLPPERSLISLSDIEAIRTFLNRISKHPILSHDYELQMFIESEFGFLPQQQHYHSSTSRSKTSFGRLLGFGVSKRFSYGSSSGGETDDEFEEDRVAASKAESRLQNAIKCLDKEIKARRGFDVISLCLGTFKLLSKPIDGIAKAGKAQVGGDTAVLAGFLEYKLQHVQTLNQTLDYRSSVVSEYDTAVKSTENKRKIMERLRSSTSINADKVTDSIDDLDDAIMFEGNMKTRMDQVTEVVQKEMVEYRHQSTEDFFRALKLYAQRQISFEKTKLEELILVGGDRFSDAMYTPSPPSLIVKTEAVSGRDDDDDEDSD